MIVYGLALDIATSDHQFSNESEYDELLQKTELVDNAFMRGVEVCECPENYGGNSCELCVSGYRRVNNQLYGGKCEKCNCEGHSDECDPFTGHCLNCKANTFLCELCISGHYGNPLLGGSRGQCKPCACPTLENNHSTKCVLTELVVGEAAAASEGDYVCTACENGYDGNKCEVCADGYYGNPVAENGSCQPCNCSGNIDLMAVGNCDSVTGKCLRCVHNTAGDHCEICKENHWGYAANQSCTPCLCHPKGALSQKCNIDTGDCECHENYEGKQCDKCKDGHGDIENMCPACNCNSTGAIGTECNQISGQCVCKTGVFGKRCDACLSGYFNFTDNGCQFCHCDHYGSIGDGHCNNVTGKCECHPNVEGNMCEKCVDGFFNISSGIGCQECNCDAKGSEEKRCDILTGQCECKPGVTGLKCDMCAPKHYGLDENGCKKCPVCPAPGQVCDPLTGECVCPPNTVGEMCENCTQNAWNYDPLKGCVLCDCSEIGAEGSECNSLTGKCKCREGFVGSKCNHCTHGYYSFPECKPCSCDIRGTDPKACGTEGACLCDENGQCPCKKNVRGLKCDQCEASSFSLDKSNPTGCTECFCFNKTNFCVQSNSVWQQIYAPDREVTFMEPWTYYNKKYNINVLKQSPANYNSYPTGDEPLYWQLPNPFNGDKIRSYNGNLRFRISNTRRKISAAYPDTRFFKYYPQVILVGNHRIILEYIPDAISEDGRYKVRLHQEKWRSRLSPDLHVTRKQIMTALQNVQGIYVRATYNSIFRGDTASIKDVSLDVAVSKDTAEMSENVAFGVEMCDCPQEYSGSSCQDPAEGYCRHRAPDYLNSEDDIALIGLPTPCACNGHSTTCDPETCQCTNCEHHTIGDFCQLCEPGYYGDAVSAGPNGCTKCACPLPENSFSDTCIKVNHGKGYVCNACKPGYTGIYCESCISGYFGNPNVEGGFCDECDCHPNGSKHGVCDPVTGQCECYPGVTGRDCSLCQERHAFIDGICASCDRGCTKELMVMVDELEEEMHSQNFSTLKPIPWKRMNRMNETIAELRGILTSMDFQKDEDVILKGVPKTRFTEVKMTLDHAKIENEKAEKLYEAIAKIVNSTESTSDRIQQINSNAFDTIQQLIHRAHYGGSKHESSDVDNWITLSEKYLNDTKERDNYIEKQFIRGTSDYTGAKELLNEITRKKFNYALFEELKDKSNELEKTIKDYRNTIWEKANQDTTAASQATSVLVKRVATFNSFVANVNEKIAATEEELNSAKNFVEKAKSDHLLSMFDNYQNMNGTMISDVQEAVSNCQKRADKYAQLLEGYKQNYVSESEEHAKKLHREAKKLKNSFADTKLAAENPLRASHSYMEIVEALKNASSAAENAKKEAKDAYEEADANSDKSMVKSASNYLQHSLDLKKNAAELNLGALESDAKAYQDRLGAVETELRKKKQEKQKKEGEFHDHDQQHERLSSVLQSAKDVEKLVTNLNEKAEDIKRGVDTLIPEVGKVSGSATMSIDTVSTDVQKAKEEINVAKNIIANVRDLLNNEAKRRDELENQLAHLKEKIREAREKATKVRTSLKSDKEALCQRSYMSTIQPSPTNLISIKYRPAEGVPNALIFLTHTKQKRTQPSEYIAIEVRDRRIVAHWDVGSKPKKVTNTHPINEIISKERFLWYQIDLERRGDSVSLAVMSKCTKLSECESGNRTVVAFGDNKAGDSAILNSVVSETKIQIGCDKTTADKLQISTNKFRGTIGELVIDGELLPLWSFIETTDECEGAFAVSSDNSGGYMFRDGFAQVDLVTSEVNKFGSRLEVQFSSYSPDGLIYFHGDPLQGDFVALELRDGRVIFKVNLGGDSYASVQSERTAYNDGSVHNIVALRKNMKIGLAVDQDDRNEREIPGSSTVLDVDTNEHFVGGVPSNFTVDAFSRFDIHWDGFFGCIQSVLPSQFSELDLENSVRSSKKSAGCTYKDNRLEPTDRVIGFPQPGFGFNMRSKQENAVLAFQSSSLSTYKKREKRTDETDDGAGYISFYLFLGYVVAHVGTDSSQRSKVVTLRSEVRCNDGNLHSVFLARNGKNVRLRVDDREVAVGILQDDTVIGSSASQMFFGGFPEGVRASDKEIPTAENLIGCISDIFYDYKRFPIIPEAHLANIGSCDAEDNLPNLSAEEPKDTAFLARHSKLRLELTAPTFTTSELYNNEIGVTVDGENEPNVSSEQQHSNDKVEENKVKEPVTDDNKKCGGPLSKSDGKNAAYFGLTTSSYTSFVFKEILPNTTLLEMSFDFRTTEPMGMIWVWANYKQFTRYFYLNLVDGYLNLEVKGSKDPVILIYPVLLSDGNWHHVELKKHDHEIMLRVDSYPIEYMKNAPNPSVSRKRMYIGNVISRFRKQFQLTVPPFVGCMRDFYINRHPVDLFQGQRELIQCSAPSKSFYVHNGGYVTFPPAKTFDEENELKIQTKFRPGFENGLVLGIIANKNPENSHILLYTHEGQLTFEILLNSWPHPKNYTFHHNLCDGMWHDIEIRISTSEVRTKIDKRSEHLAELTFDHSSLQHLRGLPINIGGISGRPVTTKFSS
uniref:Laminin subunit alpha n=1 Tax=Syphacia muris TaxID=451379 RepID=A0A0N5ATM8_9BILA